MRNRLNNKHSFLLKAVRCAVAALAVGVPGVFAETAEPGTAKCAHGGTRSFPLLPESGDLIGENRYVRALQTDTLHDLACRYNIGVEEIFMANDPAKVDHWAPGEGTRVLIPQRFILPDAPRAGIVVNIPEMRLYYFPVKYAPVVKKAPPKPKEKTATKGKTDAKGKTAAAPPPKRPEPAAGIGEPVSKATEVITFPVSMGRMDWRTPLGKTRIASKVKDPTWTPPESIRREHAAKGDILPAVVPAGPDNPLGAYAMRLGVAGYLLHGTEQNYKSFGIGMRVTHGCMRMYNEDVARLFPMVSVGTPVYLVNQPVKLGWQGGRLYLEASNPLDEDAGIPPEKEEEDMSQAELAREEAKTLEQRTAEKQRKNEKRSAYLMKVAMNLIQKENAKRPILLDREALRQAIETPTGIPVEIGKEAPPLEAMPSEPTPGSAGPAPYSPGTAPSATEPAGSGVSGREPEIPVADPYRAEQPDFSRPGYGEGQPVDPATQPPEETYEGEPAAPASGYPAEEYGRTLPAEAEPPSYDGEQAGSGRPASDPWVSGRSTPHPEASDPYAPDQSVPASEETDE